MDFSALPESARDLIAAAEIEAESVLNSYQEVGEELLTQADRLGLDPSGVGFSAGDMPLDLARKKFAEGTNQAAMYLFCAIVPHCWKLVKPDVEAFQTRLEAIKAHVAQKFHISPRTLDNTVRSWRAWALRERAGAHASAEGALLAAEVRDGADEERVAMASARSTGDVRANSATERSWEDLAAEVNRIKQSGESLRALWSAYERCEKFGSWILIPGKDGTKEALADFGLFAARAIVKLGIPPSPIPSPSEHSPLWKLYCETQEEIARLQGKERDLSDAVPFGLGVVDRDAVDPCTRAWLEVLRQGGEFRQSEGSESIKNQRCRTFAGAITDVYSESAIYCKRRARDELMTERQQDSNGPNISRPANPQTPRSSDDYSAPAAYGAADALRSGKRRGRRANQERRDAIRTALIECGDQWRDHLSELFTALDSQGVALGDFQTMKVDLGDGRKSTVSNWADLDFAEGEQRRQIIDTLRKYLG